MSIYISDEMLKRVFEESLEEFLRIEVDVLLCGVSERNSCARFAMHLERRAHEAGLSLYKADVEYNRKQRGEIKTIVGRGPDYKVIPITPDVILHSRGKRVSEDNLIAVEMKKSNRPKSEKESDRDRLRAMTKRSFDGMLSNDGITHPEHVCGYRLGAFIEINVEKREAQVEYFKTGRRNLVVQWAF